MDLNTVKDVATIAAPFSSAIVSTFLKPALDSFLTTVKNGKKDIEHSIVNKFDDYLKRSYEKQAYIKTLVFQNNKKLLHELYIPLTVSNSDTGETLKIDSYPLKLLPAYNKVMLVDTAGMGKSTLSKYLFLKVIEENIGISIFLELRQLKNGSSIIDLIHADISKLDEDFDKVFLLKLINNGKFIFFFDGFDEIPLKEKEYVTQHIQDFVSKASNNQFLITSRQDAALASFADFQRFVIKPLRQHEAFSLLIKYDVSGETADALIEKLKQEHHNVNLKSFLSNPLLVSLLFKAYDFKPTLPMRVDVFYRQVYEALFENHDLAKGGSFIREKKSKLNIDDFSKVLRVLAIKTVGLGKVEYTQDELLGYVSEAKRKCSGLVFSESDFVKDLTTSVPLFVQDGLFLRWSHKSFQEYFAALFVAQDAKGDAVSYLERFVESNEQQRLYNILEIYFDIYTIIFNKALTKKLLNEFLIYNSVGEYTDRFPGVDKDEISFRKIMCFGRRYVLFSEKSINELAGEDVKSEPNKGHNSIRQFVECSKQLLEGERIGSSTIYPLNSGLVAVHNKSVIIMEILHRKNSPVVVSMSSKIQGKGKKDSATIAPSTFIGGKEPKWLTDKPSDSLNSAANFNRVNILLAANDRIRIGIDKTEAEKALDEIERLDKNTIDDFLGAI
jgi:hypothetical protein